MAFMIVHNPVQVMFDYAPNLTCTLFEAEPYPVLYCYVLSAIIILKGMAATMPNQYLAMNHMKVWKITFVFIMTLWTLEYIFILLQYKTLCTKHNIYNHQIFDMFTLNADIMTKKPATLNIHMAIGVIAWLLSYLSNKLLLCGMRLSKLRVTHIHTISRFINNIHSFRPRVCVMNDFDSESYQKESENVTKDIVNQEEACNDLLLDCTKLNTANNYLVDIQENEEETIFRISKSNNFASSLNSTPIGFGETDKGITKEESLGNNADALPVDSIVQIEEIAHPKPDIQNQLQHNDDLEVEEEILLGNNFELRCRIDNLLSHVTHLKHSDPHNTPTHQTFALLCCPSKLRHPIESTLDQPKPVLIPRGGYQEVTRALTPPGGETNSSNISPKLR